LNLVNPVNPVHFNMSSRSFAAGLALAAAVAIVLTIAARAPAAWVGDWLQSHGKLRLVDARGTVWNGSAMLGVSDGRQILLVPGRVSWRLGFGAAWSGRLTADVSHPALAAPLAISLAANSIKLASGQAELAAAALTVVGAPFNTMRPGGILALRWTDVEIRGGGFSGSAQLDWRDAQSALSPVAPLGNYRLTIAGAGDAASIRLDTLGGPLRLEGSGTLRGWRVSFKGLASVEPDMRAALNGLIGVLGPRSGHNVLLALET
jgi:general secretion pathway protein N